MSTPPRAKLLLRAVVLLPLVPLLLLAGCGGGSGSSAAAPEDCSTGAQKTALRSYMNDWYFWYRLAPNPEPAAYATTADYFNALLYTGSVADFPADRWSYVQSSEAYERFFGAGQALGYGVSVAGLEVQGQPDAPLFVRDVEPRSDAAAQGVVRGDQVLAINGTSAHDVIAAGDYAALTPTASGQTLNLRLRNVSGERSVSLTASVYALTPVRSGAVLTSPQGRKLGYVMVKDMISQALAPLDETFAGFQARGISELVLDLRYNGGGLVSVGAEVASYAAGAGASGRTYASLLFNDRHAGANQIFRFTNHAAAAGVQRVFVLTGPRSCSASEQVINGLRGIGVDVVAIGATSCGKPVGFVPHTSCDKTYSAVNFESVNERNEGRYFDGFAPTCAVAEDFSQPLGSPAEPLLMAARGYADTGQCPLIRVPQKQQQATPLPQRRRLPLDERTDLVPR